MSIRGSLLLLNTKNSSSYYQALGLAEWYNTSNMTSDGKTKTHRRFPEWLKRRLPAAGHSGEVRKLLDELHLATVCDGAHCPNRGECFAAGTATFLILGDTCTRSCKFCAIPQKTPPPPRKAEPAAVAEAAKRMNLKYVVITSVTRDDLPDGGAEHFSKTVRAVREALPEDRVEVLVPDFLGNKTSIETVLKSEPDVYNHNIETVERLYETVRPQANYAQSLDVLKYAKLRAEQLRLNILTKSGLMVGLGETDDEVLQVMKDLREVGCDILTIGQYLAPSDAHLPVERFVTPQQFEIWEAAAKDMGFKSAACAPFVRSSYHAKEVFQDGS